MAAIRRNLDALGVEAEVRRQDALAFLEERTSRRSSIRSGLPRSPIPARERPRAASFRRRWRRLLAPGARVVTESDRRAPLELDLPLLDERRYGDTLIRIHGPR